KPAASQTEMPDWASQVAAVCRNRRGHLGFLSGERFGRYCLCRPCLLAHYEHLRISIRVPRGLVCRIDWPKLNVRHFKQEHRTLRRVTTEPPPEPSNPRTCPPCLAQVATPTLLRGLPQLAASFIPLRRQTPQ